MSAEGANVVCTDLEIDSLVVVATLVQRASKVLQGNLGKTRLREMGDYGYTVNDCGTDNAAERVDAMEYALLLVAEIKHKRSDFVIGICGSGQMMAITANRFPFIRAALHLDSEDPTAVQDDIRQQLRLLIDMA